VPSRPILSSQATNITKVPEPARDTQPVTCNLQRSQRDTIPVTKYGHLLSTSHSMAQSLISRELWALSAPPRLDYQTARQLLIAAFWRVCEIMPSQAQDKDAVEMPAGAVSGRSLWASHQPLETSRRARTSKAVASSGQGASMSLQLPVRVRSPDLSRRCLTGLKPVRHWSGRTVAAVVPSERSYRRR